MISSYINMIEFVYSPVHWNLAGKLNPFSKNKHIDLVILGALFNRMMDLCFRWAKIIFICLQSYVLGVCTSFCSFCSLFAACH
jgi:hypothetical protein